MFLGKYEISTAEEKAVASKLEATAYVLFCYLFPCGEKSFTSLLMQCVSSKGRKRKNYAKSSIFCASGNIFKKLSTSSDSTILKIAKNFLAREHAT